MKITLRQLRQFIREAVQIHEAGRPQRPENHKQLIGKHVKLTDDDGVEQSGVVTTPTDAWDVTHLTLSPVGSSGRVIYFVPEETAVTELSAEEVEQLKAQGAANRKKAGDLYSQDQQRLPKPMYKKPVQNSD